MQKPKSNSIDWDAVAEAERFGALAVSRRKGSRRAKMTKDGLTTAQKAVCMESPVSPVNDFRGDIDPSWARESESRIDAYDQKKIKATSASKVFDKIDKRKKS